MKSDAGEGELSSAWNFALPMLIGADDVQRRSEITRTGVRGLRPAGDGGGGDGGNGTSRIMTSELSEMKSPVLPVNVSIPSPP